MPSTLTLTVLLQRNTHLFPFPLLPLSLPLWHWMQANFPFLSPASNAILKPGDLLKWKKRLVNNARLSLPLTEVTKIARLTSPLPDVLRLSSPKPRLRHGRRLVLLSRPNLILNLCTLFFVLSLALLLTSLSAPLPGSRSTSLTWDPTFPFFSQRPCVVELRATFPSSAEPHALRSLTRLFAIFFLLLNFLRLPPTFPPSRPLALTKLPIPC